MKTLGLEILQILRRLWGAPLLTGTVLLTLAVAIGANILIFGLIDGVLLRPLPYPNADRIVLVWSNQHQRGIAQTSVSVPDFLDWRKESASFERMSALRLGNFSLTGEGDPVEVRGALVSEDFFEIFGQPILGRGFDREDYAEGRGDLVVLSHSFWQRKLGGDSNAVGRTLSINERSYIVQGVLPPSFSFPRAVDFWVPAVLRPESSPPRGSRFLAVAALLKPGLGVVAADREMNALSLRLAQLYPDTNRGWGSSLVTLYDQTIGQGPRSALWLLYGAVWLVLVIACVNVANILTVRGVARQNELALRVALGARRGQMARLLLGESVVMVLLGGGAGIALAYWGLRGFTVLAAASVPRLADVAFDAHSLGYSLLLMLLVGTACGLIPLAQIFREGAGTWEGGGLRGSTEGSTSKRLLRGVVIVQVALALSLLIGAALFLKSFHTLVNVDTGFEASEAVFMRISLSSSRYSDPRSKIGYYWKILERLRGVQGLEAVALSSAPPLGGSTSISSFEIEERPVTEKGQVRTANVNAVSRQYFSAMRIPVVKGAVFEEERRLVRGAALISESMRRRYWGDEDPIGEHIYVGGPNEVVLHGSALRREIVGVVGDIRHQELSSAVEPTIYIPYHQVSMPRMTLIASPGTPFPGLAETLREAAWSVDRDQPFGEIRSFAEIAGESIQQERLIAVLIGGFACVSLLLAAAGIYSVMAYSVSRRTREIGLRFAIGARSGDIYGMVLRQSLSMGLIGISLGLLLSFVLMRQLSSMLFQVSSTDPLVYALAALFLLAVTFGSSLIPTFRAASVDPNVALKVD